MFTEKARSSDMTTTKSSVKAKLSFLFLLMISSFFFTACTDEDDNVPVEYVGRWDFVGYGNGESMTYFPSPSFPYLIFSQDGSFMCQAINQISGNVKMDKGGVSFFGLAPNSLILTVSPEEIIFLEENFLKVYRYERDNEELRLYFSQTDFFLLIKHNKTE